MTHWNKSQTSRLSDLMEMQDKEEVKILYWNSDSLALPANGGSDLISVHPGLIQELPKSLDYPEGFKICNPGCFHATNSPHKWKGQRVWMVALYAPFQTQDDKSASLKREIIGEILPEEAIFDSGLACRLGIKGLSGANLCGADLRDANLTGAYLCGANLCGADLRDANLTGAYLCGANLRGAYLVCANLTGANLYGANLNGANLTGTNLYGANLYGANLYGANLYGANLSGADLCSARRNYYDPEIPGWKVDKRVKNYS